ncbi:MAG: hypothetical protein C5S40_02675 [ANME-2 cluster archaeon]|nr:hypothetical protein [ANME-2 cluster archaeon]
MMITRFRSRNLGHDRIFSSGEVHRDTGVCVKGRIALHKHRTLARVGWDRALSGRCFKVYAGSGFWSDDLDPGGLLKKSGAVPRHQKRSTRVTRYVASTPCEPGCSCPGCPSCSAPPAFVVRGLTRRFSIIPVVFGCEAGMLRLGVWMGGG